MSPTLEGFDAAVGFTVQQHLFSLGITRAHLGALLGAGLRAIWLWLLRYLGWGLLTSIPPAVERAGFRRRTSRARVRPRSLVGPRPWLVPPVGLEPTTFGLKVRSSDQLS